MPAATKTAKPFADIDAAMDALPAATLIDAMTDVSGEISTAETVDNFVDFDVALETAEEQLASAPKTIRALRARVAASVKP